MSRPSMHNAGFSLPQATRTVMWLIGANVALYVVQLILLRTPAAPVITEGLYLTPSHVYRQGFVWQLFTYGWFHDPMAPTHLLFNMLWLYLFGPEMDRWWGSRRFLRAYFIFITAGGVLTVLASLFFEAVGLNLTFPIVPHLGASGGTLGITMAWGLVHSNRQLNLLLVGPMTGRTFVLLLVGFQILVALSFSNTSATAHFGGLTAAFILCRGLWRPSRWKDLFEKQRLRMKKRRIEKELDTLQKGGTPREPPPGWKVIDGGGAPPDDPKKWN
ncbi:MAG: rhomboid family intramembrane serine protease [Myxococcota bacterium]